MNFPKWQAEIQQLYKGQISNAFMITGNIGDYAYETTYLKDYLVRFLLDKNRIGHFNLEDVYIYDINSGGVSYNSGGKKVVNLGSLFELMSQPTGQNGFIFYYPEYLIPAGDMISDKDKQIITGFHSIINSSNFVTSANIAIFVTESTTNIHPMFLGNNSRISLINIELPDEDQRLAFFNSWASSHKEIMHDIRMQIDAKGVARLTAGLQLVSLEDIILTAYNDGWLTIAMILEKKKAIIRKEFGEVIEIFDTEGLSLSKFAGQDTIKNYFKEVVIDALKNGDTDIVPKGVLLMGPPGTGKTYFAKCLAADSGINFVEFKLSKILGKYVGESEKSMEKALQVFRALSPCGVFMDEIDQSMSRGQGGSDGASSVNANLFGMLLAEMSKPSNRGKILWFAATNYPNNVDEALKRPGRFDKKIPFFAPSKGERAAIFKLKLNEDKNLPMGDDVKIDYLVEKSDGYTQAEIEAVVVKARELAKRKKRSSITQNIVELAMSYMLSNQNEKIHEMEDIALKECNDQEFIPDAYKARHRDLLSRNNINASFSTVDRGAYTGR
ncbi:MAG: ATP-binding protein [Clostridiales bacterium]|nr:ATP-binding protein [Clostridiales bacterium]